MNPVEIIALLTALIVPVKLIILMRSQRFWFKNVTSNYWVGSGNTTMIASFIVSIASLYFLCVSFIKKSVRYQDIEFLPQNSTVSVLFLFLKQLILSRLLIFYFSKVIKQKQV